ncbi:MAG: hypothetical protein M0P71_14725 [Melioribacteraceae bacterium]|jgi:hypothetical protein|nr:hypothetical protein [Melioribacteraceae bacterium]
MIATAEDMYIAVLDGIKKNSTSILRPESFNRLINDWGQDEWMKTNCLTPELNEKQINDLQRVTVVTDGTCKYNSNILYPIRTEYSSGTVYSTSIFGYPISTSTLTLNNLTTTPNSTQVYPEFMRLLVVSFKITYGTDNECDLTGISEWLDAKIMRADQRNVIMDNPFRCPKDSRLYYERMADKIVLITGTNSTAYAMRLEYIRKPVAIFFDVNGTSHVNCEFSSEVQKEIVDIAVRTYLERIKDPRWQSFLQEEMIRQKSK